MPTFAVVGHPNKGKSSIVATLAENDSIAIGNIPGTTAHAHQFEFKVDGTTLYSLVDTPGFQRPGEVLQWLEAQNESESGVNASIRSTLVEAFVEHHQSDKRFHDECELLAPILAGAGILYIVDGSKPYGAEFEVEMQILRWTGQPRMALINLIGEGDYLPEWQAALGQYFSIVRVFDAMHADFSARINLLRAFAELNEDWRGDMQRAVELLTQERVHRLQLSAVEVTNSLADCLGFSERVAINETSDLNALQEKLTNKIQRRVGTREERSRAKVQNFYRHNSVALERRELALLELDLFAEETWDLFGLSKNQLLVTGSMGGAAAGLGIDVMFGGTTLLLGATLGAVAGAVGSWFGSDELAKTKVLGTPLGGKQLQVGPISAANFPWMLLGRAWVHHYLIKERNHALREVLSVDLGHRLGGISTPATNSHTEQVIEGKNALAQDNQSIAKDTSPANIMDQLSDHLRRDINTCFIKLRKSPDDADTRQQLQKHIRALFEVDP